MRTMRRGRYDLDVNPDAKSPWEASLPTWMAALGGALVLQAAGAYYVRSYVMAPEQNRITLLQQVSVSPLAQRIQHLQTQYSQLEAIVQQDKATLAAIRTPPVPWASIVPTIDKAAAAGITLSQVTAGPQASGDPPTSLTLQGTAASEGALSNFVDKLQTGEVQGATVESVNAGSSGGIGFTVSATYASPPATQSGG